jgi:Ala-tRNA(Pro) deacylase
MPISSKLKSYLDKEKIQYELAEHSLAYTASEIAGTQHIPGKQMVKSVIIKSENQFLMCVLPAIHLVDFDKLKKVLGSNDITLAEEEEIAKLFPDYDLGAEPPFGHLYGLKVYADQALEDDDEIVFNAGTHTDVVKMKMVDFKRIVKPIISEIGSHI